MHVEVPINADHLAAHASTLRRREADDDASLQRLVQSTPAQIDAWLATNVNSLADARIVLGSLLRAVRYLYLKESA